jgi:hypothetical protein
MKVRNLFILFALFAFSFSACEDDEALTPNPTFNPEATGEDPKLPGGGGSGDDTTGNEVVLNLTDTAKQNRTVVLFDFTGVRCQFCPDAHSIGEQIENSLGEKFIFMSLHGAPFGSPAPGWANFVIPEYDSLMTFARIGNSQPMGTINWIPADSLGLTPTDNGYAMAKERWSTASNIVSNYSAPLNVGAKAIEVGNGNLQVDVEVYYTSDETEANNINIILLQDSLVSKQITQSGTDNNYIQDNVARALITPLWGEPISSTTNEGDVVKKSFNYTIPSNYNGGGPDGGGPVIVEDMKVIVYVTRGKDNILNATEVDVE